MKNPLTLAGIEPATFRFLVQHTAYNKISKILPSTSKHSATRVQRSRVVRLSPFSRLFIRAAASRMRASNSSGIFCLYFVNLTIQGTPQTKI